MIQKPTTQVLPVNDSFSNEYVKQLCLNHGKKIKLKKNSILINEHSKEPSPYIYYIVEGVCSLSGISANGREQIFLYQKNGDLLGHVPYLRASFPQNNTFTYRRPSIIAKTNCVLYEIPHEFLIEHVQNNPEFAIYLLQLLSHNYSMAIAHLKQMQEDSVVGGICRFLLQNAVSSEEGSVIPKLFTYSEISRFLGVHEVTVSKVMGRLKQESVLSRSASGLIINDEEKLKNIIKHPETFPYK